MANTSPPTGPIGSVAKWGDTAVHLKDFGSKYPVPNLIKVTKGQYRNIGVAKSVNSELFLNSVKLSKKVLAEGIKIKEKQRIIVTCEQKYAFPISYQGWFELMSEDGKPIRCLQSVAEMARVFPHKCLVRENIKGHLAQEHGEIAIDKTRTVSQGEQLTLVGDVIVSVPSIKGPSKKKFLRCVDIKGETIYLPFDSKGGFSPIAGQANISGVHNIKGILEKFRLPVMVRLVHGIIPGRLEKNSFTGVFRLLDTYTDETAFVCPLKKDAKMVPISTREPLKVVPANNFDEIETRQGKDDDVSYYLQRSNKQIANYLNSIHVLVNVPEVTSLVKKKDDLPRSVIENKAEDTKQVTLLPKVEEDIIFEEIDDIYQYVRDGGRPPPPRPRPTSAQLKKTNNKNQIQTNSKGPTKLIPFGNHVSGGDTSGQPLPTPDSPSSPDGKKDDHYWEEPIYDEIEKFHRRRKQADLVAAGATVAVDIPDNTIKEEATATITSNPQIMRQVSSESKPLIKEIYSDPADCIKDNNKDIYQTPYKESKKDKKDNEKEKRDNKVVKPPEKDKKDVKESKKDSTPKKIFGFLTRKDSTSKKDKEKPVKKKTETTEVTKPQEPEVTESPKVTTEVSEVTVPSPVPNTKFQKQPKPVDLREHGPVANLRQMYKVKEEPGGGYRTRSYDASLEDLAGTWPLSHNQSDNGSKVQSLHVSHNKSDEGGKTGFGSPGIRVNTQTGLPKHFDSNPSLQSLSSDDLSGGTDLDIARGDSVTSGGIVNIPLPILGNSIPVTMNMSSVPSGSSLSPDQLATSPGRSSVQVGSGSGSDSPDASTNSPVGTNKVTYRKNTKAPPGTHTHRIDLSRDNNPRYVAVARVGEEDEYAESNKSTDNMSTRGVYSAPNSRMENVRKNIQTMYL